MPYLLEFGNRCEKRFNIRPEYFTIQGLLSRIPIIARRKHMTYMGWTFSSPILPTLAETFLRCNFTIIVELFTPLTYRVRAPSSKLRTEFLAFRFLAEAQGAQAINRTEKMRFRNLQYGLIEGEVSIEKNFRIFTTSTLQWHIIAHVLTKSYAVVD